MIESNQISGRQIAAARALAGLGQAELAAAASISVPTLRRMESSDGPAAGLANNVAAVRRAIEGAGVEFARNGVRLKIHTWWEQHLTPVGWVEGDEAKGFRIVVRDRPTEAVATVRTEVVGTGDERTFYTWVAGDRSRVEALLQAHPSLIDGLTIAPVLVAHSSTTSPDQGKRPDQLDAANDD